MAFYASESKFSSRSDYCNVLGSFVHDSDGIDGNFRVGSVLPQSLVLDSEKGELVKCPVAVGKKETSDAKVLAALKNHSEAERRRRERINGHLATLRSLVPCSDKMNKASLLAEVITQVKELKKNAAEASKGLLIPMDADEVKVELCGDAARDGNISFRASICCDYRPELLVDLKKSLDLLQLKLTKAEISTLGNRLKCAFVFSSDKAENVSDSKGTCLVENSVYEALNCVLDKNSGFPEYLLRTAYPSKRRMISSFDRSSCSSS